MILKKKNKFEIHPATDEPIRAVVVDYTEPKEVQTQYGKKEKFAIVFETEMKMADGEHYTFWAHGYTPSIAEKSNLAKDIKKITGLTDLQEDFDLETIIGMPVKLIIEHKHDGDKVYANMTFLGKDKSDTPMRPSGKFTRERDREKKDKDGGGGASYNKIDNAKGQETAWFETKVHVGQFAGHSVADLPSIDNVTALLTHWWPTVEKDGKPSADDKRLHSALLSAKAAYEAKNAAAEKATASF